MQTGYTLHSEGERSAATAPPPSLPDASPSAHGGYPECAYRTDGVSSIFMRSSDDDPPNAVIIAPAVEPQPHGNHTDADGRQPKLLLENHDQDAVANAPPRGKYRDVTFAVAFILCAIVVTIMAFSYGIPAISGDDEINSTPEDSTDDQNERKTSFSSDVAANLFGICMIGLVLTVLLSYLWLMILMRCAKSVISIMIYVPAGLFIIYGMAIMAVGNIAIGIVAMAFGLIILAWRYCIRKRIQFAGANLAVAAVAIKRYYRGTVGTALVASFIQIIWLSLCLLMLAGISVKTGEDVRDPVVICFFLVTVWGCEVCRNIVHVTVAGTVGHWWTSQSPRDPTRKAAQRALSTSFGSIAFGALILSVLRAIRAWAPRCCGGRSNSAGAAIGLCCFRLFERTVQYLTEYSFVYVGLYGSSFIQAGKATVRVFKERGFTAVINDTLVNHALFFACLSVGLVMDVIGSALGAAMKAHQNLSDDEGNLLITLGSLSSFYIGYIGSRIMMTLLESATKTCFVCFADAPEAHRLAHPESFTKLLNAWWRMFPEAMQRNGYAQAYGSYIVAEEALTKEQVGSHPIFEGSPVENQGSNATPHGSGPPPKVV